MAVTREAVDKALARVGEQIDEAESQAQSAAYSLTRLASMEDPADIDPGRVRAAADDYAEAAQRLQQLRQERSRLRELLT